MEPRRCKKPTCASMLSIIRKHVAIRMILNLKRGGGVLHGCYCHYHFGSEDCTVRALDALRLYLEYLTHKHSVFKLSYMVYANERNESCFQIAQMQVYQVAKVGNICEPNKFCRLKSGKLKRRKNENLFERVCTIIWCGFLFRIFFSTVFTRA